jgi:hypothetical protein
LNLFLFLVVGSLHHSSHHVEAIDIFLSISSWQKTISHSSSSSMWIVSDSAIKCEITPPFATKASCGRLCIHLNGANSEALSAPFCFMDQPIFAEIWPTWGYYGTETLNTIRRANFIASAVFSPCCSLSDISDSSFALNIH